VSFDSLWDDVVSLLKFEGANTSTDFIDERGLTWTRTGSPQISTAQARFGSSSGLFARATQDRIDAASSGFAFGTGDFTIECFARFVGQTNSQIIFVFNGDKVVYGVSAGQIGFFDGTSNLIVASVGSVVDTWYHVALTRQSGTLRLFFNGALVASAVSFANDITTTDMRIGALNSSSLFGGHIDEFRVTKGVARYTAAFTPPDEPFPTTGTPLPDPTSPTSPTTGTGTGTGTTSTGPAARLTPLNLFLVTLRLPDEPVEDPAPAEALPDLPDVSIGLWDFTGATATRFQDIAGTTESTDRVGRVNNIIASGQDLIAPDATRRLEAIEGFAQGTSTVLGGLLTNPFTAISGPFYFAIKFRSDGRSISGTHLINARFLALSTTQSLLVVESSFSNDPPGGAGQVRTLNASFNAGNILSGVGVGSGDHVVELLIGGPSGDQYALDGGDWVNSTTASIQGQLVQISISHDMADTATTTARRWVGRMYRLAADTGIPTAQKRQQVRGWLDSD
jgi:hypothetical protein